jgi:MEDS: MEthanogen/methylotroph, DcmR Sensory domain
MKAGLLRTNAFWAEMAPGEHLVQIYGEDLRFLDALEGFVSNGLRAGEGVVVIATAAHLHQLEQRLVANWLEPDRARWENRYVPLLASETLSKFMVNGKPDEALFGDVVTKILARARGTGRTVRAFGEMVALLWAQGNAPVALQLEEYWHRICEREGLALFCAYPRAGFTNDENPAASLRAVCAAHSRVLPA